MATKLEKGIKRELEIDGQTYTIIMSPDGLKITPKGGRKGTEHTWRALLGGGGADGGGASGSRGMGGGMGME